ncbi:unnamed protein product, partial [Onchocerca ochengi]
LPNGKAGCYHHIKVFSSSTSEDKTSEAGTAEVVELTEQQMNENEFTNHSTVMPSTKSNVNQINNLEIRNEPRKQRRYLRNVIDPASDFSPASTDTGKMKYPQIFEVKRLFEDLKESKKTSGQMDGTLDMNGDLHSRSKPARISQIVPLTVIPKQQSKRAVQPLRTRTESI